MKIKTLFQKDEPFDFDEYLHKCGVENIELWKKPNGECLDNPADYDNMELAMNELMKVLEEK